MFVRARISASVAMNGQEATLIEGRAYDASIPVVAELLAAHPDYFDVAEVETGPARGKK
jgi:hypothetical protein